MKADDGGSRPDAPPGTVACGRPIRWFPVFALLVGTFTGTLANIVVNVPVRQIAGGLHVPVVQGTLVVTSFNVTFAVLMPLAGWLGDRIGRRRLFCLAVTTVAAGSLGAVLAPSLVALVVFRAVQGAGTAAILPTVMGLLADTHERDQIGVVLGMWAGVNGLGRAVGAPLGGALAAALSWRWIFIPALPLCALAFAGALLAVPPSVPLRRPLDWRGALALTAGCGLTIVAVSVAPETGVASPVFAGLVAGGAGGLAGFVWIGKRSRAPFIDPALLAEPSYVRSSAAAFGQMFCVAVALLAVPLSMTVHGNAVQAAGLVVFSLPATMMVLGPVAGRVVRRFSPRRALRIGMIVLVAAQVLLLLAQIDGPAPVGVLVPILVLDGAGAAFVQTPAATGATRSAAGRAGSGLGLFNLVRFAGAALGAAWVGLVLGGRSGGIAATYGACTVVAVLGLLGTWAGPSPAPDAGASPSL